MPRPRPVAPEAPRDYWPDAPSIADCVALGLPADMASMERLRSLWPALSVDEKAALGFTPKVRATQIARLIEDYTKARRPA